MRLALPLLVLLLAAPALAAEEPVLGEVRGDGVRLRAGPGMKHPVLMTMDRGDVLTIVGKKERWHEVIVPGGFACYVHGSLVERSEDGTATVTATRVLLRATPGKEFLPLAAVLDRDEKLTVLGEAGDWLRIIPPERVPLYVFEELVTPLGPAKDQRARLTRAAEARRKRLLASRLPRTPEPDPEARRAELRKVVIEAGRQVLAGEGDSDALERRLTDVALESDDDLTRGYANSLLALLSLRKAKEALEAKVRRAEAEKAGALADLRQKLDRAERKYRDALREANLRREARERPFRAVGTIERRDGGFVLVEKGRVVFRLLSKRFDLAEHVGERVGVNGRMVVTDAEAGITHLMVEKLTISPGGTEKR